GEGVTKANPEPHVGGRKAKRSGTTCGVYPRPDLTLRPLGDSMSKAKQNPTTLTGRRRFLRLAGTTAAASALLPAPAIAAVTAPDPCLVIASERDRLKAIYEQHAARVRAIAQANPLPMAGQGWPRVD